MQSSIVITGVTGALGSALFSDLLRNFDMHQVFCLVRANTEEEASRRVNDLMKGLNLTSHDIDRVRAVRADVTLPLLGLSEETYRILASGTEQIFHLAASVDFNSSLVDARIANVDSVQHVLAFARVCRRLSLPGFKVNYVSTAYVAGDRRGMLKETELARGQNFWNSYEQSKFEAEELIERARQSIPITVFRPSQIVGNTKTGQISKFFGFYEFVELIKRGRSNILVADPAARPDMVPSDYICQAIVHFCKSDQSVGKTYHLAAGLINSITVAEVVEAVLEVMGEHKQQPDKLVRPKIIPMDRLTSDATDAELDRYNYSAQKLLMRTYQPYLTYERDFDVAATHRTLESAGIAIPSMRDVIKVTTNYALRSRARRCETLMKKSH